MDELILPTTQKKVLQALVGSHLFPAQARDEWGLKGKGLVILLHGTPGSGKTLTAETAAEFTRRALLKISLAELRDDDRLEENMLRFQRYASTWQAIVLIDEADVFLEARSAGEGTDSAERNGLVAMFLRTLEYFQGIIFLTSNRVSVFDLAIKSRVHLALQYQPPNRASRRQLWRNQLRGLPEGATDFVGGAGGRKGGGGVRRRVGYGGRGGDERAGNLQQHPHGADARAGRAEAAGAGASADDYRGVAGVCGTVGWICGDGGVKGVKGVKGGGLMSEEGGPSNDLAGTEEPERGRRSACYHVATYPHGNYSTAARVHPGILLLSFGSPQMVGKRLVISFWHEGLLACEETRYR